MKVGKNEVKNVSRINQELFAVAKETMESEQHLSHIGWSGLGKFIDYLEVTYDMKKVSWKIEDFLEVDRTLVDDLGIITAVGKGHLAEALKRKEHHGTVWDGDTPYRVMKIVKNDEYFKETGNHKIVLEKVE